VGGRKTREWISCLDRLSNRLTKILAEASKLRPTFSRWQALGLSGPGNDSVTINHVDSNTATPISSPPDPRALGVDVRAIFARVVNFAFVMFARLTAPSALPKLESLVRPEELTLELPKRVP
jgi:hypothetical protein